MTDPRECILNALFNVNTVGKIDILEVRDAVYLMLEREGYFSYTPARRICPHCKIEV